MFPFPEYRLEVKLLNNKLIFRLIAFNKAFLNFSKEILGICNLIGHNAPKRFWYAAVYDH